MKDNCKLGAFNFLIVGQLKTSRTETLEEYLKLKVRSVGVIGLMSPFASNNEARCTLYEHGIKADEFSLTNFNVGKIRWWNKPFICLSFLVYIFSIFFAVRSLNRKFDIFIGIATFPAMMGLVLKKLGYVQKVVYYCIDYYPPPDKLGFNSFVNFIYKNADIQLIKRADIIWEISPRIKNGRQRFMGLSADSYKTIIVPLGYANGIHRDCPFDKRERWTLGFVGTLSENQGLQLVIEAMPLLVNKFPEIRVRIIGHGPYTYHLKGLIKKMGLEDRFIFHGFVRDDDETYDILSHCMIGLATWTGEKTDNSLYADPGKPKLYALVGLPIIITSTPSVSQLIAKTKAGEVINYCVDDFVQAVEKIIASKERFQAYINGIKRFKPYCLAENIFNGAILETIY